MSRFHRALLEGLGGKSVYFLLRVLSLAVCARRVPFSCSGCAARPFFAAGVLHFCCVRARGCNGFRAWAPFLGFLGDMGVSENRGCLILGSL